MTCGDCKYLVIESLPVFRYDDEAGYCYFNPPVVNEFGYTVRPLLGIEEQQCGKFENKIDTYVDTGP